MQLLVMPMAMWLLPVPVPPDRDHVALLRQEVAAGQIAHQLLVDRRILEDEVGELLGERQLGYPHLVADRARVLLGDLGLEQGSNDLVDAVLALDAGGDDLVIGRPHAGELQGRHHLQDLRAIHGPPPSRPHRRRGDWAVVATHRSERNRREAEPAVAIAPVWQWARPEPDRCAAPGCSGSRRHCTCLSQAPQRMLLLQRSAHPTPLT